MIKISLVDDEILFLNGIEKLLSQQERFTICNSYISAEELIHDWEVLSDRPDIILVDMKLPGINGIELTKYIINKAPSVKVIGLSSHYTKVLIFQMLKLGAASYLPKNVDVERLVKTIIHVYEEGFYFDEIELKALRNPSSSKKNELGENGLTDRELEVLLLICQQFTTQEIAKRLYISVKTVERHRTNLFHKTQSKNVVGLVLYALKYQLVEKNLI
ncbi:MAG: response regulator transcription factor [Flavobacteriales bacterium]|nr:response regulator transcription factor [Flavobacteriales bacterium]